MSTAHPIITAATSSPVDPDSSNEEAAEPIIRLKLDKPLHWEWELTTSADKLPVIQLLDKDGRLLVETTGRTAQRARGSFQDGLKSFEEFPKEHVGSPSSLPFSSSSFSSSSTSNTAAPLQGNRNMDGFSTKFGGCEFGYKPRKSRSEISVTERDKARSRRLSSGSGSIAKRQNEATNNSNGTSKRYSAGDYLRRQIIDDLHARTTIGRTPEEIAKERCTKVKAYLRCQSEMALPESRIPLEEANSTLNGEKSSYDFSRAFEPHRKRNSLSCDRATGLNNHSRRVPENSRSEAPAHQQDDLNRVRAFLREKLERKMLEERRRDEISGIKKRYSDYRRDEGGNCYRTRKVQSETSILGREIIPENKENSMKLDDIDNSKNWKNGSRRTCRRSRSDVVVVEAARGAARLENHRQRSQARRESSSLEKRKVYRKTRSDVLLARIPGGSLDGEAAVENPPRRIRSQDNVDESWREYKERKRHDRMQREREVKEEDFMSRPRWKDLQTGLCAVRNCKFCRGCGNSERILGDKFNGKTGCSTRDSSRVDSNEDERPGTSLQENYLVIGETLDDERGRVVAKIQVKDRGRFVGDFCNYNLIDCGYNSITKRAFKDYRELYARSNVKKSSTFKIVDGSEDLDEGGMEEFDNVSADGFGFCNGEGSLADKSNEDIAKDYFKRVYELLKKRQEETRRITEGRGIKVHDDSSSSNYVEDAQRKRHRRRKKEKSPQGEEIVTVTSTSGAQEVWKAQRLSLTGESPSNRRRGCRPQLQAVPAGKRNRPAPPASPISSKVNAKDINKYSNCPNKENTPGNALNGFKGTDEGKLEPEDPIMGSNLSRHNGKGLNGRRTQSSGNLCDPKGKLNSMGKILVPCSSAQRERYKFCGSLPNHLDDKDVLDDNPAENNNIMGDTVTGNFGGTLPHKKRSLGVHFSDGGPTGTLDLVKHRSQDSLDENDPWRYQQSDLDLVRCRHGNFDSVRRNRSTDTASNESTRRYARGSSLEDRCHRNSDLDLVGTLPKRKQDTRSSVKSTETNSTSSQPSIPNTTEDDLLMKIVHKPDCELLRHRQQFSKCIDLQLSKLTGTEPQDQGYASERSPEDEHPPSLPGQPFPSVTPESTFRVTLQKSSRGLGLSVSGGGTAGPVRVKRLFPQQPAALSNKLQSGDILLAANGVPLTGLTNYEALEVLRTTPSTVELVVCRLPGDTTITPPGAPPPPPARREPPPAPLRILNPLPPLQIEPCGEFDIEMKKVGGSLGFTLRKADSSALGHYVRALVREPALSDGRIRPGDKIVAVDGAPLSPMSHEEAVQLLRQCGPTVKLRLYRDLAQTPVSALSPTEPDHPLRPPRTSLRQEAVDMLCDLAVRKLSPGTSSGSSCRQSPGGASCNSPRRLRRLATRTPTTETDQESLEKHSSAQTTSAASQPETSDSDQCSIKTQITNSQPNTPGTDIIDPPPLYDVCDSSDSSKPVARPSFLDLSAPQGKPHFQFCSQDSEGSGPATNTTDEPNRSTETDFEGKREANLLSSDEQDNDLPLEPASMPPVLSSTSSTSTAAFSYKNPAYQSANPACGAGIDAAAKSKITHSSDQDIPGKILGADDPGGSKGLLKWKGVMFAPDDGVDKTENEEEGKDTTDSAMIPSEELEQGTEVFMVELTRGWNSRLGFSLQPEGDRTVISVVHPDSVAAKDGRLKQGDVLMMVNDESVEHMTTADIIDLLRKIRGSIGITVMRRSKRENAT